MKNLQQELEQRRQQNLYRQRKQVSSPQGREIIIDGHHLLNFCSNDYLGFANHPKVKQAFINAVTQYGVGSGAAHLVNGHTAPHHQLEEALAEFCGFPRCLLMSTGYMANLAVAQSLCGRGSHIIEDKLNHASLIDAAQLSDGKLIRFPHCNYNGLQQQLARCNSDDILVSSDAVFSMDGDEAELQTLQTLCKQHNAWMMIDDAHGFGVLGNMGRGSISQQSININDTSIYMATLGKALGTAGAFIAGSEQLIEYLIQTARSYIYTTAMPAAIAAATLCSLKLLQQEPQHQQNLQHNILLFKQLAQQSNITLMPSNTAIQPVLIGDSGHALRISEKLLENGLHITAIRPPTVANNTARLRITLRADHKAQDIEKLVFALKTHLDLI